MRLLILAFFLSISGGINAYAETISPKGCKTIPVAEKDLALSASKGGLFLLNNTSNTDLWVTHPITNPGASAGWSSRLQAGHWSALELKEKSFELICIESKPGHEQQVPCSNVLTICEWKTVKIPPKYRTTSFWAAEDMPLKALKNYIEKRGYELPEDNAA